MGKKNKQSKYVGYSLEHLKDFIKDIDKEEEPEFWDEIKELIVAKEFQIMAAQHNSQ